MEKMDAFDRLDRHALVMAMWTPAAFLAAALLMKGLGGAGIWWFVAAFAAIIVTFCCHIVANAILGAGFSTGERAMGVFAFAVSLSAYLVTLAAGSPETVGRIFAPVGLGLLSLVVAVVAYMVIAHGPRRAFEAFDVIRDNNLRPASRLPHRGGRR